MGDFFKLLVVVIFLVILTAIIKKCEERHPLQAKYSIWIKTNDSSTKFCVNRFKINRDSIEFWDAKMRVNFSGKLSQIEKIEETPCQWGRRYD